MQRIRRTDEEWMDLIRECKSSGVSDQVWLKQKKIPASSYYRKYQQLCGEAEQITPIPGKQLTEIPETHEIVQVSFGEESNSLPVSQSVPVPEPAVILKVGSYTVEITNSAGADAIRNTLLILKQIC